MDDSGKSAAASFLQALLRKVAGNTPTQAALGAALDYDAEAIILITDGNPTDNDPDLIVRDITRRNGGRKEILAVGIGDYRMEPEFIRFLENLGQANKGGFIVSSW